MGGFQQSALSVSQNAAVQKDAGISEEQAAKLKTLNEESGTAIRESMSGFGGLRDLPEDERAAKIKEMNTKRAEITAKFKSKMADILDAKQVERVDQITLQAAGNAAYTDAAVVKSLKLTQDQQDKIADLNKSYGEKRRELFPAPGGGGGNNAGGGGDFQERIAKSRELEKIHGEDLAGVLTADQKTQFGKMKGKEFDVAQLRPQFGGGGGGRRPGGGDGAGGGGGNRPPRRPE